MTKVHEEANMRHRGNSETDRLMRECLQMQVELKFSRD